MVETTWMVQYPWPVEITYDQEGEFLGHEFKNSLIEQEFSINTKPSYSGNPQTNTTIEIIYQVLGNIVRSYNLQETYVDNYDPCMDILAGEAFAVQSTYLWTKQKSQGQLVFGQDMILIIDHIANWRYTPQRKQAQIEKGVIRENSTIIY